MNRDETRYLGGRQKHSGVIRRKSVKRSFRNTSFGVRSKVKRNISMSRRQRNIEQNILNRNNEVREERSKSFIVKRKSFRKPRKWSNYLKNNEDDREHLPRVKGFWRNQKFVRSRIYSLGKIWTEQLKRTTDSLTNERVLTIPRPTLVIRRLSSASSHTVSSSSSDQETSSDEEYIDKESVYIRYNSNYRKPKNLEGKIYPKIVTKLSSCLPETDSGVYSSVSGNSVRGGINLYTSERRQNIFPSKDLTEKQVIPNMRQKIAGPDYLQMTNQSKPEVARYFSDSWKISQEASWRHLILSTLPQKYSRDEQLIQKRAESPLESLEDSQEEELCQKFERIYQKNRNGSLDRRVPSYFSIFPSGSLPRISPTKTYSVARVARHPGLYDRGARYRDKDLELSEPSIRRHQSVPPGQDSVQHRVPVRQKSVPVDHLSWTSSEDWSRAEHCYTASRDQREKEVEVFKVWPERRRWVREKDT